MEEKKKEGKKEDRRREEYPNSPDIGMARLGNNSLLVPSKFSRGRCLNCYSGPVQSIAGFFTCLVSGVASQIIWIFVVPVIV
ncbi:hypothetical protein OIU85_008432 [Salix viminalis]|uniref:Uncharacterized protein n=1 Tax=Salix viminalis TaxID=40686 RepID=A0A9Q0NY02_SALVM|nr:hypothetical protein OIU85_008432 [Salix viminalis]